MSASPRVLIHATSVALGEATVPFGGTLDMAVLLLGASDSGKSDVALRLIGMGAKVITHPTALSDAWQALALDLLSPEHRAAMMTLTGCAVCASRA